MPDLIKIPYLNPLRFHNEESGKFFIDTIPAHEERRGYVQKFYSGDRIDFQLLLLKENYISAAYRLIDSKGSVIHSFTPAVLGVYGADYDVLGVATDDNINGYLTENETYYLQISVLTLPGEPTDTYTNFISDPFTRINSASNTVVLEYTHDANRFDVAFYPDPLNLLNKKSFQLRVEGGLPSDGFSPESKDVFYLDQAHDTILLDSIPFNTYKYLFGNGAGIPNYLAAKINRIFSLSNVKLDGRSYVKADGAKLEPIRDKYYPFAAWQIELIEPESHYSLVGGDDMVVIPEIPDPVYFGSAQVNMEITDYPDETKVFVFDLVGDNGYSQTNKPISQTAGMLFTNLPVGNYTVSVREDDDYTLESITPEAFTVDSEHISHTVNLLFFSGGSITVTKTITDAPEDLTYFHVTLTGQSEEPVIVSGYVNQEEPAIFKGLKYDEYVLTEDSESGYTTSSITPESATIDPHDRNRSINVVNEVSVELTPIKYGALYNWYAASKNGGSGAGSIAPAGWHVPNKTEFETLIASLGGSTIAGGHLKEAGLIYWDFENADNSSGFYGRGGGYRDDTGYIEKTWSAIYLSITPCIDDSLNYFLNLFDSSTTAIITNGNKFFGQSIRPLKNTSDWVEGETVTDIDGTIYPTVKIGNQVWMAANLAVTKFNDGTPIPNVTSDEDWAALTTPGYCWYDNDITNK